MADVKALPRSNAQVLSTPQVSRPYWGARTPRWICQIMVKKACIPVHGGVYRINEVSEPWIPIQSSAAKTLNDLPHKNLNPTHSHEEGTIIDPSFATYNDAPKEVVLKPIQSIVKVHTRIPALYSAHHNQLEQQISLTAEYMYETKEYLIFNHPDYGLVNSVSPKLQIKSGGPPTPDLLDDMLTRVWKMPDFYVMNPEALHAFHGQCNKQGISLESVEMLGSSFTTWRGLPIITTNKLLNYGGKGPGFSARSGKSKTNVLVMRIGEERQGVLSLYAAGSEGSARYPFITVDFMGMSDDSVSSYLLSMYAAMAVVTPGALAGAEVTI